MLKKKWHRQFKPISVFKQAETFKQLSKLTPPYLLDTLIVYDPAKGSRLKSRMIYPAIWIGELCTMILMLWNSLMDHIRQAKWIDAFKSFLKGTF